MFNHKFGASVGYSCLLLWAAANAAIAVAAPRHGSYRTGGGNLPTYVHFPVGNGRPQMNFTAEVRPVSAQRIVFLGDSITDGDSYPLMVKQALQEAGRPVPIVINAGIGGDTAHQMLVRLDRDVFPRQPTLVTLSAGANDGLRGVTPQAFEADITAIIEKVRAAHIPMVLLSNTVYGPTHADAEKKSIDVFNDILHRLATQYGYPIAEVNALQKAARANGISVIEADDVHPNYAGQSLIARAVLDALGYKDVPLPKVFKPELMPGIITPWKMRPVTDKNLLDEITILGVAPDANWKSYTLPEAEPLPNWWLDQERKRGFALSLDKLVGPAPIYRGVATLESKTAHTVFFNTGSGLQSIWLNRHQIYQNTAWHGWHAGRERIPAQLKAGANEIIIETSGQFFLSVTEDDTW